MIFVEMNRFSRDGQTIASASSDHTIVLITPLPHYPLPITYPELPLI
jgi:hypothetical protein